MSRATLTFLRAHQWLVVVLLCFVAIGYTKYSSDQARSGALAETCHFIDSEHDRARAQLVTQLKQLFRPPYTGSFKLSPEAAHKAFVDTKDIYDHVIDTRPTYCKPRSAIPPFPSEKQINPAS